MKCQKCGRDIPDNTIYCPVCGAQQTGGAPQQPVQSGPQNPYGQNVPQQTYARKGASKRGGCLKILIIAAVVFAALWLVSKLFNFGSYFEQFYVDEPGGSVPVGGVESVDLSIPDLRERYTTIKGNGEDVVTVMVYMIGSDLESQAGMGTNDLSEMFYSGVDGNVNLIVQTGGSSRWHVQGINARKLQRWQVTKENITLIAEGNLASMTDPNNLSDFVTFCSENYPANRYALILWDHGGGTAGGYGRDEFYPNNALMLSDIDSALGKAGVKFDFVGYDACLMGTVENAYMLEKHADYLIASEELEPGEGWKYDGWLPKLCENTSIETVELGKLIVDSFIGASGSDQTLSVIDLREIPYTYKMLTQYMNSARAAIEQRELRAITNARSGARSYNDGQSDMIDIVDFVSRTSLAGRDELINAVNSCVKYRNNCTIKGSNGLSMYFPYAEIRAYSNTRNVLQNVGVSSEYLTFFDEFISVLLGGQYSFRGSTSVASSLGGTEAAPSEQPVDETENSWYHPELVSSYQSFYDENAYTEKEVVWSDENDAWVLTLTETEWDNIDLDKLTMQALLKTDNGFIDLGTDQSLEIKGNDLLITYDGTWVAIEGKVVPFYTEAAQNSVYIEGESNEDDEWYSYGYVPALLTRAGEEKDIELILKWDNDRPSGYCAGYRDYAGADAPVGRKLLQLEVGDKIEFVADYYKPNGDYDGAYAFGEPLIVNASMIAKTGEGGGSGIFADAKAPTETKLKISYAYAGDYPTLIQFRLVDIYQTVIYTEPVEFS